MFNDLNLFSTELNINLNYGNPKSLLIIVAYRLSSYIANSNIVLKIIGLPIRLLYGIFVEWILGVELPDTLKYGWGLKIHHGYGLVVNTNAIIGRNVTLKKPTIIGSYSDYKDKCIYFPRIGNNVIIYDNIVIFGNIENGDNCIIGAGSDVSKSFPPNSIIAGNPIRLIKELNENINHS